MSVAAGSLLASFVGVVVVAAPAASKPGAGRPHHRSSSKHNQKQPARGMADTYLVTDYRSSEDGEAFNQSAYEAKLLSFLESGDQPKPNQVVPAPISTTPTENPTSPTAWGSSANVGAETTNNTAAGEELDLDWDDEEDGREDRTHHHIEEYLDEELGDDYADTDWLPPTKERSMESLKHNMFRGGKASVWNTSVQEINALGVGVGLYFKYLLYLIKLFGMMTIFGLPALIFFSQGKRVSAESADFLNLVSLSLGNAGDPALDCSIVSNNLNCNVTMVEVFGFTFPSHHMSYVVTACDWMYSLIFFISVLYWQHNVSKTASHANEMAVSPKDYTVMVTG